MCDEQVGLKLEDVVGRMGAVMIKMGVATLALSVLWKASDVVKNAKIDINIKR